MLKVCVFLLVAFAANALASGPLRFATSATYPPFVYLNAGHQLVGFDIELAKALCEKIARQCLFTNNDFDRLLPSLKFNRYDAVISGLDITEERREEADFTQPYLESSGMVIAVKGRYASLAELRGKRVGVADATTLQAWLQSSWPDIIPVAYDNYQNALLDIRSARLDAIFGETPSMQTILRSNPGLDAVGKPITDNRYFSAGLGIAVRKGDKALLEQLNGALQSLSDDGTLHMLKQRWLGPAADLPAESEMP
ncbi:transporter substrate-binding domain-containing protein [Erwinia sp. ACCC 02193]|jgi:arginine transport system substrate-binding protein|uniref:Transporter substrate-binding domain-containing protein n=1 Tax=Erwinia aeris TaxID=3239803 RepID=A0ABV4E4F1_9GAMM|nr:transporter substrate-binding domain-containing protein [Erwinia sp. PsM31]MDN4626442.1 transporter substrate-binding domain-containing protein [Erwinia sp. PsM31]